MSASRYRIVLHREAAREMNALPKKLRVRIAEIIDGLAEDPRPASAAALKGRKGAYRIRIGDHRLIYEVRATEIAVYIVGVAHAREVDLRLLRHRSE
ncbi:MAG: type II toxin-antitoxin system RelE/ParE family toxin [Myxococcales bacterium]|nr:MAG: type II toxin-antitoxin system RelE/ParE family toxin [Myxococcales bacterium]